MDLRGLTVGYLSSDGYEVNIREKDLVVGRKQTLGEMSEFVYIWVPEQGNLEGREQSYLTRFGQANEVHPQAQKFLLVPSLEGLSPRFRRDANQWFNVKVRVPVQLFDTSFKWETRSDAPTAARELREKGKRISTAPSSPAILRKR